MNISQQQKETRYKIIERLGTNLQGGRITYKATDKKTNQLVVIKEFHFLKKKTWIDYKPVEREIQVLKNLSHPHIPKYLDFFETDDSICLVQEYIKASHLDTQRGYTLKEVKQIARQALEILVYLQQLNPIVIHRDIKPENLLINSNNESESSKVYLVDFGFSRIGSGEAIAASSVMVGTTGFMPPEQIFGHSLGANSDLYSLGVTLICLLAKRNSGEIGKLIDYKFSWDWQKLLPAEIDDNFVNWLKKMVEPDPSQRFVNARAAINALSESQLKIQSSASFIVEKNKVQRTLGDRIYGLAQNFVFNQDGLENVLIVFFVVISGIVLLNSFGHNGVGTFFYGERIVKTLFGQLNEPNEPLQLLLLQGFSLLRILGLMGIPFSLIGLIFAKFYYNGELFRMAGLLWVISVLSLRFL